MVKRLSERLGAARQHRFVGRDSELALFQSALIALELPFHLLYVFGPGGVGKTMLLTEFASMCKQYEIRAFYMDTRHIEPVPELFLQALQRVMTLQSSESPIQALAAHTERQVLLLDTYERIESLDWWLGDVFLPQLSDQTLVVVAGRNPPSLAWRSDPGWQTLMHILPLRNLSPDESRAYLAVRTVPADQYEALLAFTHGHPLALSLVADLFAQRPDIRFQPETAPDIIKTLLEQFLQKVPGPAHRAAMEVCALVRLTTETLLSEVLAMPDAHELFSWLRGLSFIESGALGLFPHDLAREALMADLRWRNPGWYTELHRRARKYYLQRLPLAQGKDQQRIFFDYVFLHRTNPLVRPHHQWQDGSSLAFETARSSDFPVLLSMVARYEGEESARLAAYWFERQAQGVMVLRDMSNQTRGYSVPIGFVSTVMLTHTLAEAVRVDPATNAAWRYLEQTAPLRPGEIALLFRFWMNQDTYQDLSPVQSLIAVSMMRHFLGTQGLAFTFTTFADPDYWAPLSAYTHFMRLREADFEIGGRRYGVYGHDWRVMPPTAWLESLAEFEGGLPLSTTPLPPSSPPLVVLSQTEFNDALREALRVLGQPHELRNSPLLRSRLVVEQAGTHASTAERVAALQTLVQEACTLLQASPRDAKAQRALDYALLHPTITQEQAAEALGLPFSTFRRHLRDGMSRVIALLWQWELQGRGKR